MMTFCLHHYAKSMRKKGNTIDAAVCERREEGTPFGRGWESIQEKICRDEAALNRVHGQTSLLKHGET
jgi:hypothetical protein